jgi:gliding motility-associated-like protein
LEIETYQNQNDCNWLLLITMKKYLILLIIFVWFTGPLKATHQRAGEITFKYISGLTYEVTIVTYSYAPSPADRYELEIKWGDNTSTILQRSNGPVGPLGHMGEIVGPDIKRNLYIGTHTYPGASTFKISLEDPNRNYGIQNIPNSVEVPFFIETELIINPFIGANSSPQLLLPPIDQGCVTQPFLHNPGAFDPDGDSLSFRLTTCRGAGGENIPGFQLPNQVGTNVGGIFTINSTTGEILWDSPEMQGEYNIAFLIEEWRNGLKIGYITRDMQITIVTCDNNAPIIAPISDTCVEAGDTLQFRVSATDADSNRIKLTAAGAPFEIANPAEFYSPNDSLGRNSGIFTWITTCNHVRKNPYQVYFKATDDDKPVNLFDLKSMNITVVGPAPKNLTATALGNTIQLKWNKNRCSNISGYKIYRRNGFYGYIPGYCETGVPAYTGYQLIFTLNTTDTSFVDNDLSRGIDYCYMVVAKYPDGAESYASNEACAQLKKDVPVITNVSIQKTGTSDGRVYLAWSKPTELDPVQAPGPYKYLIYRSDDLNGAAFNLIDSLASLNDTIYIDDLLNTKDHGLSYRVDLYNDTPGLRFLIGPSQKASSVFISFSPGDQKLRINFNLIVPWTNEQYVIFRQNESTLQFDSIASTFLGYYIDDNLVNGKTYCYYVKAIGTYGTAGITDPLINYSQEACGIPIDNEAPCTPVLDVQADCDNFQNILTWENPDPICSADVVKYLIYYQPPQAEDLVLLDSVQAPILTYTHSNLTTIAGCYSVAAVDSVGNLSSMSDTVCIDSDVCGTYRLPNVFTPNGDERNDYFVPFPYSSVEKIDMQIVNRWGTQVFATQDPAIKWDGKLEGTNQDVPDGVYYYICDVYELTLNGTVKRTLKGSITIIR